ncbi:polyprenyl synthetase family protein [Streptomyces sp. HD]|uniref:polyprenyl synthetase family protein n=1 Tax=Streptomyces sp. HD TaxID=3020892 RepID=UPI00232BFAEE|nr:polyprenyl synthetase family protein [Streptomyces sp. HD]MDC0768707.1 polyprenyl synthetase family protein [Streptomyces sp. HD]
MSVSTLAGHPLHPSTIRTQVDAVLQDFLDAKSAAANESGLPGNISQAIRQHLHAGGKRLRPLLCVAGWHAAGGRGDTGAVLRTAAALEMFHAFCLIHDDIMDNSATRHGQPTIHHHLATLHGAGQQPEHARQLGEGAALLVGDMALAWSDELLHSSDLAPRLFTNLRRVVDVMREEVIYGQYLDLTAALGPAEDVDVALKVIRYKTAKYTVERPLHIGATLAGANDPFLTALSGFALPLGEAFQLRDDLLGVFGNPEATGKPALDDLREGKHTVLIALTLNRAHPAQAGQLRSLLGNPQLAEDQAEAARRIITATNAPALVEAMIAARYEQALTELDHLPCPSTASAALRHLATLATERAS